MDEVDKLIQDYMNADADFSDLEYPVTEDVENPQSSSADAATADAGTTEPQQSEPEQDLEIPDVQLAQIEPAAPLPIWKREAEDAFEMPNVQLDQNEPAAELPQYEQAQEGQLQFPTYRDAPVERLYYPDIKTADGERLKMPSYDRPIEDTLEIVDSRSEQPVPDFHFGALGEPFTYTATEGYDGEPHPPSIVGDLGEWMMGMKNNI